MRITKKICVKNFLNFLVEKNLSDNIETVPIKFLAKYLHY